MWLAHHDWTNSDRLIADMLNSLALDDQNWGGDVNGGGYHLSNVILDGSGGFQYTLSPIQITQGSDGESRLELRKGTGPTSLLRWSLAKDATAETGANAGANFTLNRCDDAGAYLGTPFAVNRATGLITMGAQHWTGPIDGGGQTISNITVAGALADPTTTKGDLLVRSASALSRLGVATDGMVLMLDSAQALGVKWAAAAGVSRYSKDAAFVAARQELNVVTGANVTLTMTDDGPNNRVNLTIAAAAGGSGGMTDPTTTLGDLIVRGASAPLRLGVGANGQILTADSAASSGVKWAAATGGYTDPLTTKGDLVTRGTSATARLAVGTDGQVLTADAASATGVKWAAAAGGQTPWTSDIDAAVHTLNNVASIAIGKASTGWPLDIHHTTDCNLRIVAALSLGVTGGGMGVQSINDAAVTHQPMTFLASQFSFQGGNVGIGTSEPFSRLSLGGAYPDARGRIAFYESATGGGCRGVGIASPSSGVFGVAVWALSTGVPSDTNMQLFVRDDVTGGAVGVGVNIPTFKLDVAGDVNCTGAFRVGGVAIGTGGITTKSLPAKALNTNYQNTTGKPMFVTVIASLATTVNLQLLTDATTSPSTFASYVANTGSATGPFSVCGWVLPNHYYKASTTGTLTSWIEWT